MHSSLQNARLRTCLTILMSTLWVLMFTVACGSMGESGELRLSDVDAQQPGALYPIAVGASVHYRIEQANTIRSRLVGESLSTTTEDLIDLTFSDDKKEIIVTGKKAGRAVVTVTTTDDKEDTFHLDVRDVDNAMFNLTRQKNAGSHQVATVRTDAKMNMPPGSKLTAEFRNFVDEEKQPLAGKPETIAFGTPEIEGNFQPTSQVEGLRWIFHAGDEGSTVSIPTPFGDNWQVRSKEAIVAADFRVLSNAGLQANKPLEHDGDTWIIPRKTTVVFQFVAQDADGYDYVGQESLHASAAFNNTAFQPELGGGIWQMDGANTCTERLDDETPGACNAWEELTELRFQLYGPDDDVSTTLTLQVGDFRKTLTLKTAPSATTSGD